MQDRGFVARLKAAPFFDGGYAYLSGGYIQKKVLKIPWRGYMHKKFHVVTVFVSVLKEICAKWVYTEKVCPERRLFLEMTGTIGSFSDMYPRAKKVTIKRSKKRVPQETFLECTRELSSYPSAKKTAAIKIVILMSNNIR